MAESLPLPGAPIFNIHPVVVLSVLDHHRRRNPEHSRVFGILLGESKGNNVVIKECFPMNVATETEDMIAIDDEHLQKMLACFAKAHPSDEVVGWYATGEGLNYVSSLVHQKVSEIAENPVHVHIDTALQSSRLAMKAYQLSAVIVRDTPVLARFEPVVLETQAVESEKIGIDALLNAVEEEDRIDAPTRMLSDTDSLLLSTRKLITALERIGAYVDDVVDGKQSGDVEIGRLLTNSLSAVPAVEPSVFASALTTHTEDLKLVAYLSNLTKAQISLADKINALLA